MPGRGTLLHIPYRDVTMTASVSPSLPPPTTASHYTPKVLGGMEHELTADCWCHPRVDYVDPDTGSVVYVHHLMQ